MNKKKQYNILLHLHSDFSRKIISCQSFLEVKFDIPHANTPLVGAVRLRMWRLDRPATVGFGLLMFTTTKLHIALSSFARDQIFNSNETSEKYFHFYGWIWKTTEIKSTLGPFLLLTAIKYLTDGKINRCGPSVLWNFIFFKHQT